MAWLDETVRIGGFPISDMDFARANSALQESFEGGPRRAVFFANTHFVVTCQDICADIASNPSILILNDGIGVSAARALITKTRFAENLNGSDFIPRFLRESVRPLRLYLLGASPNSVEGAAMAFGQIKGTQVAGKMDFKKPGAVECPAHLCGRSAVGFHVWTPGEGAAMDHEGQA
jgi:beta-1,4-glucosyltransferase